jgi:DNA topoisomerase-1
MDNTAQIPLPPERAIEPALDPLAAARAASLRYISDATPGITRRRAGTGIAYRDPHGQLIRDRSLLKRIRSLAVPPAWTDVWICPDSNGRIQAVGRDARGRKQYRYHPRWRSVRDEAKYGRMLLFARMLPRIRARVEADLARRFLPRQRILAALVRLLEITLARVGNIEYVRENKSFGLTTLRNRHARVRGGSVEFDFRGKHGIQHHLEINDSQLARIVRKCQDLPGQDLFQYVDDEGQRHAVGSQDVNDYLREISGEEITAKDFRTWARTNLAAIALRELAAAPSEAAAKQNILRAIEAVAKMLGNTRTICRKCYIHPAIFEGYLDGSLLAALKKPGARSGDDLAGMKADETAVTAFLRQRLGEEEAHPRARVARQLTSTVGVKM